MKLTAFKLREEDAKKWTLKKLGEIFGVHLDTVSGWFIPNSENRNGNNHPPKPDARTTLSAQAKAEVVKRIKAGEPQAKVAADFKIAQSTVSKTVAADTKRSEQKAKVEEIRSRKCVGAALGVSRETVRNWFIPDGYSANWNNPPRPHAQMKLNRQAKAELREHQGKE